MVSVLPDWWDKMYELELELDDKSYKIAEPFINSVVKMNTDKNKEIERLKLREKNLKEADERTSIAFNAELVENDRLRAVETSLRAELKEEAE